VGDLIGEYSTVVAGVEDAKVAYLTADHLGSPRINTDRDGKVTARHDYHPYGEEIITAQRTSHAEYTPDSVRKQFTGYERDGETNLDFAEARTYFFGLGRFGRPDPDNLGANEADPQSWNGYSYALNNPVLITDPSGLIWLRAFGTDNYYWIDDDVYKANLQKDKDYYKGFIESNYAVINFGGGTGRYAGAAQNGQRVLLGADGGVHPISDEDWGRGTVHTGTDDPLQQLLGGTEDVMQYWRTPIYAIGTAEMAALSIATAGPLASGLVNQARTAAAVERAVQWARHANKLHHIFNKAGRAKEMAELVRQLGSKEAVLREVLTQMVSKGAAASGGGITWVQIGRMRIEVSYQVVDGIIKIGSFYPLK